LIGPIIIALAADHLGFWKHASRLAALGSVAAAGATIAAVVVAAMIGKKAGQIAHVQKEIVGLQVLRDINERFDSEPIQQARCAVASAVVVQQEPSGESLGLILDLFEEMGLYTTRSYVPIEVASELMSFPVICYWYAGHNFVMQERARLEDTTVWCSLEELIRQMHLHSKASGVTAWAQRPSAQLISDYFDDEIRRICPEHAASNGAQAPAAI
jgi:hypothetical protein